jgi:hypothetical protein
MFKKKTVLTRIDKDIVERIDSAMFERFKNKLVTKKEFSRTEGFRLFARTPEFNLGLEKIKKLPKKEDVKW